MDGERRPHAPYEGVIFDLDGTLTSPGAIDFAAMRRRIGMPEPGSILHWIQRNARSDDEARSMESVVWEEEDKGLERMELGEGLDALIEAMVAIGNGARFAICTRNSHDALSRFDDLLAASGAPSSRDLFQVQLARGHVSPHLGREVANKPSPEPVHEIVRAWGLDARFAAHDGHEEDPPVHERLLFVGDGLDDLLSGRRAGLRAGWMAHGRAPAPRPAHLTFGSLLDAAHELQRSASRAQAGSPRR